MSEKPILFRTEMVKAILDGTKTETRRLKCNLKPGDLLWVKETYTIVNSDVLLYKADAHGLYKWKPSLFMKKVYARIWLEVLDVTKEKLQDITWEGSQLEGIEKYICGKTWGSGFWYKNYSKNKKSKLTNFKNPITSFESLWDSINGKKTGCSWYDNPTVKVVKFKRVEHELRINT